IEILAGLVNSEIEKDNEGPAHPMAKNNKLPNAEDLMTDIESIKLKLNHEETSLDEKNALKDKLRFVQNRVSWLKHQEHKNQLQEEIDAIWKKLLQQV
ncbi:MAG: ATPase, partial [Bacteroidia bacterium]